MSWKSEVWEFVQAVAIAAVLSIFIITFVMQSFLVEGSSMYPTLSDRDRLFVNKLVYRFREPQRGEIIVFRYPADPRRNFIKRVIGIPGDRVAVSGGIVYVNGVPLEEPYINEPTYGRYPETVVPENTVFVLGDNRNHSQDSREPSVGFVPYKNIVGEAFVRYWPLTKVSIVDSVGFVDPFADDQ
ncbi:MAG: signal peptidase I [Bacillota bacterium]|nr:signal peptidase I [Bacillota bacterium]HOB91794.1 signal peptidase I [Bacillota bacterium]HPZ55609.1 signal peptidase I [Bacillota bacterium]HQD18111.1 signal peptidase I [Bacillota bacterium]